MLKANHACRTNDLAGGFDAAHEAIAEARGIAAAAALIGESCVRGLQELRRLDAEARAAYAVEDAAHAEAVQGLDGEDTATLIVAEQTSSLYRQARNAADEAGERFYFTLVYLWRLAPLILADIGAKARLLIDFDNEVDEDLSAEKILKQIADFVEQEDAVDDFLAAGLLRESVQ